MIVEEELTATQFIAGYTVRQQTVASLAIHKGGHKPYLFRSGPTSGPTT